MHLQIQNAARADLLARDAFSACALIRLHKIAQLFRVEALGQRGGADQIAEHDGELAAFGVGADGASFSGRACLDGWGAGRRLASVQLCGRFEKLLTVPE
jgi:hypothetical protein